MKLVHFLLSACAAAAVVASPHGVHIHRRHHDVAVAARAPAAILDIDDTLPVQRRQSRRRCKNRSSSSVSSSTSVANKQNPTTTSVSTTRTPATRITPTTTQVFIAKTPTTPPAPTPTTAASNNNNNNNNLPSFMSGVQTGQGTFFIVALGACGWKNTDDERVVAVSWRLFDNFPGYNGVNPNTNPICGQKIRATYQGKSTTVTVVDRCADDTCLITNLDFSRAAFKELADFSVGRIYGMTWEWAY